MGSAILGWCAGRNPPSVQRRHSAKRATRVSSETVIDAYLPFHPAGQSFHRSHPTSSTTQHHRHTLDGRFVSVLLPVLSHYAFTGVASLLCGRSFLKRSSSSRSKAARQLTNPT